MAHYRFRHPWDPNYALPEYVLAEPPGRGTFTTKWLPRRTISTLPPDYLAGRMPGMALKKARKHTLSGDSLGASEMAAATQDPISMYGTRAAQVVLVEMNKVPPKDRSRLMRDILKGVDASLVAKVDARLAKYKRQGMAQGPALRKALEESFREGITQEFARYGKKGKVSGPGAMSGITADITGGIKGLFSGTKSTVKKIGGLACDTAKHPASSLAAGTAAAAYGTNPDNAVTGVAVAQNVCGGGGGYGAPPDDGVPWLPIAAVGGAVLVAALIIKG